MAIWARGTFRTSAGLCWTPHLIPIQRIDGPCTSIRHTAPRKKEKRVGAARAIGARCSGEAAPPDASGGDGIGEADIRSCCRRYCQPEADRCLLWRQGRPRCPVGGRGEAGSRRPTIPLNFRSCQCLPLPTWSLPLLMPATRSPPPLPPGTWLGQAPRRARFCGRAVLDACCNAIRNLKQNYACPCTACLCRQWYCKEASDRFAGATIRANEEFWFNQSIFTYLYIIFLIYHYQYQFHYCILLRLYYRILLPSLLRRYYKLLLGLWWEIIASLLLVIYQGNLGMPHLVTTSVSQFPLKRQSKPKLYRKEILMSSSRVRILIVVARVDFFQKGILKNVGTGYPLQH